MKSQPKINSDLSFESLLEVSPEAEKLSEDQLAIEEAIW
jgi:hypothetical protein